jgi:hypothetical protein
MFSKNTASISFHIYIYTINYTAIGGLIYDVPLLTKPGSSLIILPLMRILHNYARTTNTFLFISHLRTYCCSNLVAISSSVLELLTLSQLMLNICRVSKTFGEWYQKTNKTEDTNKLTLLAFKIIVLQLPNNITVSAGSLH